MNFSKKYFTILTILLLINSISYTKEYIGIARGYNGEIKVSVNIINNEVDSITVLNQNESSFTEDGIKSIISTIIEKQETKVDNVAGASATSLGLKRAISRAIKESGIKLIPKD